MMTQIQQADVNDTWNKQVEVNGEAGIFSFDSGVGKFKPVPSLKWFSTEGTLNDEGLKKMDIIAEAYFVLLAERQSITGPVDQAPLSLFIVPGVMNSFIKSISNSKISDNKKLLDEYKRRIIENNVLPEQFDKIIFLNSVSEMEPDQYILTVFTIDEFDETSPRVEVYHTFGEFDDDDDDNNLKNVFSLVKNQLKFVVEVLGNVVNSSDSVQNIRPLTSPISLLNELDIENDAKLINVSNRNKLTNGERFGMVTVMAQFVSYTVYHDDSRFMHIDTFRKENPVSWQREIAKNLFNGSISESDLSKRIVHLPQNAVELESLTMWPHSRILHPTEQKKLALLFFRNKEIWSTLTTDDSTAQEYKNFLEELEKPPETPIPEKTVVSNIIRQPVPTASSRKDTQSKETQDTELETYYRRVGSFFSAHARETISSAVIPSKNPSSLNSSYIENGWASGFPIFRKLPPREYMFDYQWVKLINKNSASDWLKNLPDKLENNEEDRALSTLKGYINIVIRTLSMSDGESFLKSIKEEEKDIFRSLLAKDNIERKDKSKDSKTEKNKFTFRAVYQIKSGQISFADPKKTDAFFFYAVWFKFKVKTDHGKKIISLNKIKKEVAVERFRRVFIKKKKSNTYNRFNELYNETPVGKKGKTLDKAIKDVLSWNGFSLEDFNNEKGDDIIIKTWETANKWAVLSAITKVQTKKVSNISSPSSSIITISASSSTSASTSNSVSICDAISQVASNSDGSNSIIKAIKGKSRGRESPKTFIVDNTAHYKLRNENLEVEVAQTEQERFEDVGKRIKSLLVHKERAVSTFYYFVLVHYLRRYRTEKNLWEFSLKNPQSTLENYERLMSTAEWQKGEEHDLYDELTKGTTDDEIARLRTEIEEKTYSDYLQMEWKIIESMNLTCRVMLNKTQKLILSLNYQANHNLGTLVSLLERLETRFERRDIVLKTDGLFQIQSKEKIVQAVEILESMEENIKQDMKRVDDSLHCIFINNCPAPRGDVESEPILIGLERDKGWWKKMQNLFSADIDKFGTTNDLLLSNSTDYYENVAYFSNGNFLLLAEQENLFPSETRSNNRTILDFITGRASSDESEVSDTDTVVNSIAFTFQEDDLPYVNDFMKKELQSRILKIDPDRFPYSGAGFFCGFVVPEYFSWIALGEVSAIVVHRIPVTTFGEGNVPEERLAAYEKYLLSLDQQAMANSVREYVYTGSSDDINTVLQKLSDDVLAIDKKIKEVAKQENILRVLKRKQKVLKEALTTIQVINAQNILIEIYPARILSTENKIKDIQQEINDLNTSEQREVIKRLKQKENNLKEDLHKFTDALKSAKEERKLTGKSKEVQQIIRDTFNSRTGSSVIPEKQLYQSAMIPSFSEINQPHSLRFSETDYNGWLLRSRGGKQTNFPRNIYNSEELVCGLTSRTASVGDFYLKKNESKLSRKVFTSAAREKIRKDNPDINYDIYYPGKTKPEDIAYDQYEDAKTRFPVIRSFENGLNEGKYTWQTGDEGVIIATSYFWKFVPQLRATELLFKELYSGKENDLVDNINLGLGSSEKAKKIEKILVQEYKKIYNDFTTTTTTTTTPVPPIYVKVILLNINQNTIINTNINNNNKTFASTSST